MSRPVRALWIEISGSESISYTAKSRPVRALWIEMAKNCAPVLLGCNVEAREGLVD